MDMYSSNRPVAIKPDENSPPQASKDMAKTKTNLIKRFDGESQQ
jgi:hypothetical protein